MHRRRARSALVAAASLLLPGCFTFARVDFDEPAIGRSVRAELTGSGEQELLRRFGPGVSEVRGTTLSSNGGSLALLVESLVRRDAAGAVPLSGEAVSLRRENVAHLYEKRLAARRTALFVAGVAGTVAVLTETFGRSPRPATAGPAPFP